MKTTIDIINILWQRLNTSSLKTEISGEISKEPVFNSKLEDVIINALAVLNIQYGPAVVNINAFVPDIQISRKGGQIGVQNTKRLNELAKLIMEILQDQWTAEYNYDVQQALGPFKDEESGKHYMNIRIEFYLVNL